MERTVTNMERISTNVENEQYNIRQNGELSQGITDTLRTQIVSPLRHVHASTLRRHNVMTSSIVNWDTWEAPKPWSPKAISPLGHKRHFKNTASHHTAYTDNDEDYGDNNDERSYYDSPQVDWTPPKLPACAHSTPTVAPGKVAADLTNTPLMAPPGVKRRNNAMSPKGFSGSNLITNSSWNLSASSSGYGSNSSAAFQFSPTALTYGFDNADNDDDVGDGDRTSFSAISAPGSSVPSCDVDAEYPDDGVECIGITRTSAPDIQSQAQVIDISPLKPQESQSPPEPVTSPIKPPTHKPSSSPPQVPPDATKPKEPYFSLIANALLKSEENKLVLGDIYDILLEKYPYFRTAEPSWRNVIRHNLSVNDCFVKVGRAASGRGYNWGIHPSCVELFQNGDFRRKEAKRHVQIWEDARAAEKENRAAAVSTVVNQARLNGAQPGYGTTVYDTRATHGFEYYAGRYGRIRGQTQYQPQYSPSFFTGVTTGLTTEGNTGRQEGAALDNNYEQ